MKTLLTTLGILTSLTSGTPVTYTADPPPEPVTVVVEAEVTAYSEIDSCHYPNCAMASGKRAYIGAVACPRSIELGTKVEIEGKTYTCEDRTAKRYDGRFDIFMGYRFEAYEEALRFGIQTLSVEIK